MRLKIDSLPQLGRELPSQRVMRKGAVRVFLYGSVLSHSMSAKNASSCAASSKDGGIAEASDSVVSKIAAMMLSSALRMNFCLEWEAFPEASSLVRFEVRSNRHRLHIRRRDSRSMSAAARVANARRARGPGLASAAVVSALLGLSRAQIAVEAAHTLHAQLKAHGLSADDIQAVRIRTQQAAMCIINKKGRQQEERTAQLRRPRDARFSANHHDPAKRSIGNAITLALAGGTVLDEVAVEYPIGHKRRRAQGPPLFMRKFENHIRPHFNETRQKEVLETVTNTETFLDLPIDKFTDLFVEA
ncbi:hypothetical protein DFH11DRAFT_1876527 [Phellopilus nigrolimitatus]|nr:hypothetical protein DFH11DRAFT_1876527 [Phellopilus nigrolimitatus]